MKTTARLSLAASLLALVVTLIAAPGAAASCKLPMGGSARAAGDAVVVGGRVCGGTVRILARQRHSWQLLGRARVGAHGQFRKRVDVNVGSGQRVLGLRLVSSGGASLRLRVRVHSSRQGYSPEKPSEPAPAPVTEPATAPEPAPTTQPEPAPAPESQPAPERAPESEPTLEPPPSCPLSSTSTSGLLQMTTTGCNVIGSDTSAESSPLAFWSSIQCASTSRYSYVSTGGEPASTATGASQANSAYRKLTVIDGDEYYGERCELGENSTRSSTAFYREGEHRVTYFSERLPSNFPISTGKWQTVMQMKQAQPSHDAGTGVALEMQVMNGRWYIAQHWNTVYSFPAKSSTWTRFAWDVYYSRDPNVGWLQVSADLNGDGDFEDPGERSPVIHGATLATEVSGYPGDGIAPGTGIPSHLRMGIYHDSSIPCPGPSGCSIDVDNVQVVTP